ncbi:MAG TPA: dual specificity protein phosphatase family protein [Acidimicrobiales bacterium]|nr:dual specificity protein phosphatase family protein [Acidimicrobiales bacterium]
MPTPWLDERSRNGGIDEIPIPGPGRLWLCGKHFIGPDPEQALQRTGAAVVVCLNESGELTDRYPEYVEWLLANRSERAIWFPLPDMHAPPTDAVTPFFQEIERRLAAGDGIVIHCGAGVGRAGTIAAALLMRRGVSLDDALATVAAHRPMAGPQTLAQALFLEELAVG